MLNKTHFTERFIELAGKALKKRDNVNVVDARVYINNNYCCEGIFNLNEIDGIYDLIKDKESWFIDFYENIKGMNTAEFLDVAMFSEDFNNEEFVNCVIFIVR